MQSLPAAAPAQKGAHMSEELRRRFDIPGDHHLVLTRTRWDPRDGQDAEFEYYDETDSSGNVVGRYMVRDSAAVRLACAAHVAYEKIQ
jgi:hypothetical protein